MKRNLKAHFVSMTTLLLLIVLFAVVLASIRQMNWLNSSGYDNAITILSMVAFLLAGFMLGYNVEKRGLLHAAFFSLIYLIIVFLVLFLGENKGFNWQEITINLIRTVLLVVGSIFGRNLRG